MGFRLFLGDHPRLEFSPLTWDDVKEYMISFKDCPEYKQPSDQGWRKAPEEPNWHTSFPGCIIKVTVIRPGETAPASSPHHCWERVGGKYEHGSSDLKGVDWRTLGDIEPTRGEFMRELHRPKHAAPVTEREKEIAWCLNRYRILMFWTYVRFFVSRQITGSAESFHIYDSRLQDQPQPRFYYHH